MIKNYRKKIKDCFFSPFYFYKIKCKKANKSRHSRITLKKSNQWNFKKKKKRREK